METLRRMFWDFVCFVEVLVSVVVHVSFAVNMFLKALWSDFKLSFICGPQQSARVSPVIEADESEVDNRERSNVVVMRSESDTENLGFAGSFMEGHEKAPIVLVHGIFGFGAEVSFFISVYDLCFCHHWALYNVDVPKLIKISSSLLCLDLKAPFSDCLGW